ncbi:MAG TPA: hypothetical protein VFE45_13145 [Coriobacteriia bacterium]|nr:hypothetical protein [Coriobacteriia bacterium]
MTLNWQAMHSEGAVHMSASRWSLRNIYLYLVCLITLIMVIVGAATAVGSIVEIAYPDPGYFQEKAPLDETGKPVYSEEEWARQQDAQTESSRRYSVLGLVSSLAFVFIAGPVYLYHWRKIETEKAEPVIAPAA